MEEHEPLINVPTIRYRLRHLFIAVTLLFLSLAVELYGLSITQYVYQTIASRKFPNSSAFDNKHTSICDVNKSSESYLERTTVQQTTAKWDMYKTIAEAVPAILASSVLGSLSDRYGRRRALFVNVTFTLLGILLTTIGVKCSFDINLFILFAVINNVGGGIYGALSIGFAYVSDITEAGRPRSLFITLLDASIGLGMTVSGLVSGYIIEKFGYFYTSLCSCFLVLAAVLVVVFPLPDSLLNITSYTSNTTTQSYRRTTLSKDNETNYGDRSTDIANQGTTRGATATCGTAKAAFEFYFRSSKKRFVYIICGATFVLACLSRLGKSRIEILYALNTPFCWSPVKIGHFVSLSVASSMLVGIAAIKLLQRFFAEEVIAILSALSNATSCILEAFAYNDLTLFLVPLFAVLSILTIPMMRAIMSKITPPHQQGALFAGLAVMEICVSLTANVVVKIIYINTIEMFRGTAFLVYAAFSVLSIGLLLLYRCKRTS
ncbi:lysosomal proton-coupled steroid conjugate and bile acid symporter SLC46A3-like [Ylistrum balloti]|uniref:lysosomal proton-coupled steroid conjugate and bile acid symporter SLC46A3-like n=1 Tax=Ylistrum balloti TaxID=509963 RepID=UPI002905A186|nr:lysosomal proton-coupled steroid conjugate and bile acid symporter SLC46A3-like [Ylistrum balloti]